MAQLIGRLFAAARLFAGGAALSKLSRAERSFADAMRLAAVLSPRPPNAYEEVEQSLGWLKRIPRVGVALITDARDQRMRVEYAAGRLAVPEGSDGHLRTVTDADDVHEIVSANAAYRVDRTAPARPEVAMEQLDSAARRYAQLLERHPEDADAAFNYEYVLRVRSRIARTNRVPAPLLQVTWKGDLPLGPTIHGMPGAPPRSTKFGRFEILVPLAPEEADMPDDARRRSRRGKG